jgi:hypothetical protein
MAIPNVNQITSTLRTMSDQQLQQYAMLHKNDPYILPMAVSESNSRKQMRSEQQGLVAGQRPQPKVADADIAGMLPEEQGIGALPTPNMERMADGGIAGYGDDGSGGMAGGGSQDASLVYNNEPVMRMAGGGAVGFAGGGSPEMVRAMLKELGISASQYLNDLNVKQTVDKLVAERAPTPASTAAPAASPAAAAASNSGAAYDLGKTVRPYLDKAGKVIKSGTLPVIGAGLAGYQGVSDIDKAKGFYDDPNVPTWEKAKQAGRTALGVAAPYVGGVVGSGFAPVAGTIGGAAAGAGLAALVGDEGDALKQWRAAHPQEAAPAKAPMPTQSPESDWPTAAPTDKTPPRKKVQADSTGSGATGSASGAASGTTGASGDVKLPSSQDYIDKFLTRSKEFAPPNARTIQQIADEQAAARKAAGVEGEANEAYKKSLEEEGKAAVGEKDRAFWMSVALAGATAAGGKSQYAAQNIADGLGVGLKDYQSATNDLKKAEKERQKAIAAIEEARRAEKRGDVDKTIAARDKEKDAMSAFKMHQMNGIATLGGHEISGLYSLEGAKVHAKAAGAAAGAAQRAQIDMINRYGTDPTFAANYDKMQMAKREPMSIERMRATWDDPTKRLMYQKDHPNVKTFEDYLTMESGFGTNNSGYRVVGSRPN